MPKGSAVHRYMSGLRTAYNGETKLEDLKNLNVNHKVIKNVIKGSKTRRRLAGLKLTDEELLDRQLVTRGGFVEMEEDALDVKGTREMIMLKRESWIMDHMIDHFKRKYDNDEKRTRDALICMMSNNSKQIIVAWDAYAELWRIKILEDLGIDETDESKRLKPGQREGIEENPGPNELSFMPSNKVTGMISGEARKTNTYKGKISELVAIPLRGAAGKYNYAGPGTKIEQGKLKQPINGLDNIALKHDLAYGRKDNQSRADRNMLHELKEYQPKKLERKN